MNHTSRTSPLFLEKFCSRHSAWLPVLFGILTVGWVHPAAEASQATPADQNAEPSSGNAVHETVQFSKPNVEQIRGSVLAWADETQSDTELVNNIASQWQDLDRLSAASGEQLLDHVINSFAVVDGAIRRMVQETNGSGPVEEIVYDGIRSNSFFRSNVRLFHARWLAQHRYFDEAVSLLEDLTPDDVVDPASLFFYRAVCRAELLRRTDAMDDLTLLLNNTVEVPERFQFVGQMLLDELRSQADDGLDHVSRLMKDVERRLDLGRPGQKTQDQEEAIIAAIDELLEQMEKQNQQQGGQGGSGSQQNQAGNQGADQSQIKGAAGDGEADHKELKETGKWGMLDDKAEAKARELIQQQFPPNFLDQIGRYTRKLAEQKK